VRGNADTQEERSMITAQHIVDFEQDGFVLLRRAFAPAWVDLVRGGIEQDLRAPGPLHTIQQTKDAPGHFVTDFCMSQRIEALRRFVLESNAGEIAARLMRSTRCNFFYDAMWAKGPGTPKRTPWHQDQPYYPINGRQVCILWMPVDPVVPENSLECIRSSHAWNRWFQPQLSRDARILYGDGDRTFERMPDIEANRHAYDIVSFSMEPGDCVVFAGLNVHGAPGNTSDKRARRALSIVWMGDDAVFAARPGKVRPLFEGHNLRHGDSMDCDYFPRVWPLADDVSATEVGRLRFAEDTTFRASI
jgi:ectoine hydroxylase-related dioxygenase (phytanoyl-CoA dioxygenase family)